ncbi:MAG: hypothetical protein KAT00_00115 [Planctomycetes bacterium]|nr:hypothetical protein [Planctomycetota bacterium]
MIKINFARQRAFIKTEATISGEVLTLNSEIYNLSELSTTFAAEAEAMVLLNDSELMDFERLPNPLRLVRTGDDFELTIPLTHGSTAPQETLFPTPIEITGDWELDYIYDINVNKIRKEKADKIEKARKAKALKTKA